MAEDELAAVAEAPPEPPAAPAKPKGKAKPAAAKKGKDKKGAKATVVPDGPSIAGHPRAVRSVARAKGWGALIGFGLGAYESLPTHAVSEVLLRALIAGAALYLAAWAISVFVWRRLVVIEIKAREQAVYDAARAAYAARQQGTPAGGQG